GVMEIVSEGTAAPVAFSVPSDSLTINAGAADDIIDVRSFDSTWAATLINLNGDSGTDEIRIARVPTGTTVNSNPHAGLPDTTVIGAVIGSPTGAAISLAQANTGISTTDFILGTVNVSDSGGVGELVVDDSGNVANKVVTFTGASISGVSPGAINYNSSD